MDFTLLLVPFFTHGIMYAFKWLMNLKAVANGPEHTIWLRVVLLCFSLIGVLASSWLNGAPVDLDQISSIVETLVATGVVFGASHGFYTLTAGKVVAQG